MADAIIGLGDIFTKPQNVEFMKARALKCVELCKEKRARSIIFTGGFKTNKAVSEARFMAEIAFAHGIPKKHIILEEKARTTVENAVYSRGIMDQKGFKSAVVVTSPHHMRRVCFIFQKIMRDKALEFIPCENTLGVFEGIPYRLDELFSLLRLRVEGFRLPET